MTEGKHMPLLYVYFTCSLLLIVPSTNVFKPKYDLVCFWMYVLYYGFFFKLASKVSTSVATLVTLLLSKIRQKNEVFSVVNMYGGMAS